MRKVVVAGPPEGTQTAVEEVVRAQQFHDPIERRRAE